jgi:DNA-binding transcriptional MerR regulator
MNIPKEFSKLYYSIGEVSEMFGVSNSLIRYWENEFPSLRPKKTSKGDRKFRKRDILEIEKIYVLVKEKGYTLDGARKVIKSKTGTTNNSTYKANLFTKLEIIDKLENLKLKMLNLKSSFEEE